tara:strand:- start:167 stop:334 length:168 start_codon:yes stop_codon:yes gene_type:complete
VRNLGSRKKPQHLSPFSMGLLGFFKNAHGPKVRFLDIFHSFTGKEKPKIPLETEE